MGSKILAYYAIAATLAAAVFAILYFSEVKPGPGPSVHIGINVPDTTIHQSKKADSTGSAVFTQHTPFATLRDTVRLTKDSLIFLNSGWEFTPINISINNGKVTGVSPELQPYLHVNITPPPLWQFFAGPTYIYNGASTVALGIDAMYKDDLLVTTAYAFKQVQVGIHVRIP